MALILKGLVKAQHMLWLKISSLFDQKKNLRLYSMPHHPTPVISSVLVRVHIALHQTKLVWPYLTLHAGGNKRNFHCHMRPGLTYSASRATVFLHGRKGGKRKNPLVFSSTAAPEGVHTVHFDTGKKLGHLRAIRCQACWAVIVEANKKYGQTYNTPVPLWGHQQHILDSIASLETQAHQWQDRRMDALTSPSQKKNERINKATQQRLLYQLHWKTLLSVCSLLETQGRYVWNLYEFWLRLSVPQPPNPPDESFFSRTASC